MNVDMQEARRLIMLSVKNNPSGIDYPRLDRLIELKIPDMIFGDENKLMPLLDEMVKEGVLRYNGSYFKGPNFPENL